MFQGRSSVLVVISRCVGCERQSLIAFIFKCARLNILYMSYTPFYCRHPTRRNDAKPGRADCRLVAESAGLRAASRICLGRECLGPERISARIIEVGFSIALIRRSGRPASSLDKGRPLRLSCVRAVSDHCGLSGTRASHHSPASQRCIIAIYHINPFSQDRLAFQA
jgi:hypothetical protein